MVTDTWYNEFSKSMSSYNTEYKEELFSYLKSETDNILKQFLEEDLIDIYSAYFNREEILELIKFYESEVGQKSIELTLLIYKESMSIMLNKYSPSMQENIEQKLQELDYRSSN